MNMCNQTMLVLKLISNYTDFQDKYIQHVFFFIIDL